MFSDQEIKSFQNLWWEQFHEEISGEKALEQATALISLMKNIYKPMSAADYEKFKIKN